VGESEEQTKVLLKNKKFFSPSHGHTRTRSALPGSLFPIGGSFETAAGKTVTAMEHNGRFRPTASSVFGLCLKCV